MRTEMTQVQIHADVHESLRNFVSEAYSAGKIWKPSYNEAIKYLLEKEVRKKK
jgi:hypothetical protein